MRNRLLWLFDSPQRLRNAMLVVALVLAVLFASSLVARLSGTQTGAVAGSAPTSTPTPVNTDLIAPSPEITDVAPTLDYGPSTLIALEATDAYLDHDLAKFDGVAQPEAAESVNSAPAPRPGQKITGNAVITEPGPTQQTVHVPTTDGVLEMVMVIQGDEWWVDSIKYVR